MQGGYTLFAAYHIHQKSSVYSDAEYKSLDIIGNKPLNLLILTKTVTTQPLILFSTTDQGNERIGCEAF